MTAEPSCKDEARIGQQGTLTRVWAKRGTRPRAPHDQRYDWAYLFGAACPQRRVAAGLVMPAANAEAMSLHLTAIGRKVAAGSHAALILDGAGYHLAAALTIPENVTLVRLPPYAPELNPIENVWEYLRGNKLAITVFDDYDDIVDKTCDAWNFFEQDPMRIASITTRTWATQSRRKSPTAPKASRSKSGSRCYEDGLSRYFGGPESKRWSCHYAND